MSENERKDYNTLPFMDGQFNIYQFGIVVGYISSIREATKSFKNPDSYFLGVNIHTRLKDDKTTILACAVEGDMAYEFSKIFDIGDQIVAYTETYAIYEPELSHSTNRTRILGWTCFRNFNGNNVPFTADEEEFVARCLKLYHKGAPIPEEETIYKAKAILNKWDKDKWKKGKGVKNG